MRGRARARGQAPWWPRPTDARARPSCRLLNLPDGGIVAPEQIVPADLEHLQKGGEAGAQPDAAAWTVVPDDRDLPDSEPCPPRQVQQLHVKREAIESADGKELLHGA